MSERFYYNIASVWGALPIPAVTIYNNQEEKWMKPVLGMAQDELSTSAASLQRDPSDWRGVQAARWLEA